MTDVKISFPHHLVQHFTFTKTECHNLNGLSKALTTCFVASTHPYHPEKLSSMRRQLLLPSSCSFLLHSPHAYEIHFIPPTLYCYLNPQKLLLLITSILFILTNLPRSLSRCSKCRGPAKVVFHHCELLLHPYDLCRCLPQYLTIHPSIPHNTSFCWFTLYESQMPHSLISRDLRNNFLKKLCISHLSGLQVSKQVSCEVLHASFFILQTL